MLGSRLHLVALGVGDGRVCMMMRIGRVFLIGILITILAVPVLAQEAPARDPEDLARRLLGYTGEIPIPPPTPLYEVGATERFWVTKVGADEPTLTTATLAIAFPELTIWIEDGVDSEYDAAQFEQAAIILQNVFFFMRIRGNENGFNIIPQTVEELDALSFYDLSDVDNDPRLFVLFARDLNTAEIVTFSQADQLPAEWVQGGYSNQHEMLTVNTSAAPGVRLDDPIYLSLLLRGYYRLLFGQVQPEQVPWLRDALAWGYSLQFEGRPVSVVDIERFLSRPEVSLVDGQSSPSITAGQLFLRYLGQRFGTQVVNELAREPGEMGLAALDVVLARNNFTDLASGQPISADAVFADYVLANALNVPVGDGRFVYTGQADWPQAIFQNGPFLEDTYNFATPPQAVNQFASTYLSLTGSQETTFRLSFEGADTTPRLPMPDSQNNRFYWSGAPRGANTFMTRAVDLSEVGRATLSFDAWYSLAEHQNYGYVSVSTDDGQTWSLLPTDGATRRNPYGLSYGAALTGISATTAPRPFPFLGVGLAADGITITSIREDSPLQGTDVVEGDVIAGYDGALWQGPANIPEWLGNYAVGDTVNLYIQRGEALSEVPVTLTAHPTRFFPQEPTWITQTADLTPYAGQRIVLRFEYVSVAEDADLGWAIDNIRIPEIEYADDAEAGVQGWFLGGWQQISNQVAQRYLVQAVVFREGSFSVDRLIGPGDAATSGAWDYTLGQGELILITVSGVSAETTFPASYTLSGQILQVVPPDDAESESP
jgi:hypothetical protein